MICISYGRLASGDVNCMAKCRLEFCLLTWTVAYSEAAEKDLNISRAVLHSYAHSDWFRIMSYECIFLGETCIIIKTINSSNVYITLIGIGVGIT